MEVSMILKGHVNKIMTIAFAVTLIACNGATENISENAKDTVMKNEVSNTQNVTAIAEISVSNIDSLPSQIKYEGKVVDAKMWKDKSGEHYVFITQKNQGEYLSENWLSKLNAYMYTKADTGFVIGWQVRDNASISPEISYINKSLAINDIDNDGEAEVWFFYSFSEDGADPMPLKMILYSKEKKLAIRGVIPRSITDLNLYKKTIDAKGLNSEIENFASKEWDKVATDEMKRLIGDDVTQSKDFPIKYNKASH
jgi:hypothetical protein